MQKIALLVCTVLVIASCNTKELGKKFTVDGVIRNSTAKMIYLEKVPAGSEPTLEDSAQIGKDGKFSLGSDPTESVVFNLRLDQSKYPIASVINDTNHVSLDILMQNGNNEFAQQYDVKGSPASLKMRDYVTSFVADLKTIFFLQREVDSLKQLGTPDSILVPRLAEQQALAEKIKTYSVEGIQNAGDPALAIFQLGYYQSTANTTAYGLSGINNEDVMALVNGINKKFPAHQAIAAIKRSLEQSQQPTAGADWVGKEAPDFSMPDVNGKQVALSSFRGKYVLVDFWASWCGPCREENPNVVSAYNQFKGKNFTILGVSLDRPGQKDQWVKAIMDDKLTWPQVSELQYWQSKVVPLYGLDGIPFNVLVDPSGKIIAQGLRGGDLTTKLAEVLN